MKRLTLAMTALIVPAAIGLAVAVSSAADTTTPTTPTTPPAPTTYGPCPGYGPGAGNGWGQRMGMGPGRGAAWGPGMQRANWGGGRGPQGSEDFREQRRAYRADANHDGTVTVDEVKSYLESRHDRPGFENLKVGTVKEKDDSTITADIVTKDGSLVWTLEFPRHVETTAFGPGRGHGFGPGMWGSQRGFDGRGQGFGPGMGRRSDNRGGFGAGMLAGLLADGHLSVDEVKGLLEQRLAMWNNPNLKLGEVKQKDATTISADIVTKDGSLVDHLEFNSQTGRPVVTR